MTPSGLGQSGFSLIEVMIVIALIGTLAAIAVPNYIEYREKARNAAAIADIRAMEKAIANFALDTGRLPASLAEIGMGGRLDPWGTPYQYVVVEGSPRGMLRKDRFLVPVNSDYDLYSMGQDRKSSTPFTAKASQDDIVRAGDGAYVGLASEF
ncbi:MAG: prepilin-type N-terminal cleavage/methylation domain-containing protein [Desulfobacterales bacterium]|jgi:general secretion pathway protein G